MEPFKVRKMDDMRSVHSAFKIATNIHDMHIEQPGETHA